MVWFCSTSSLRTAGVVRISFDNETWGWGFGLNPHYYRKEGVMAIRDTSDHGSPCAFTRESRVMITQLCKDIAEIKDKLLGRPSWAVTALLSGLMSATVALLTLVLRGKGG